MSDKVRTLTEIMSAVPASSSLDGKSVVLTDANGDMAKMNAELAFFKFKCRCLFGEHVVHLKLNVYLGEYSLAEWKNYVNNVTGWGVSRTNTSAGDIVVVCSKSKEGNAVVLYAKCLDEGHPDNRLCKGLFLEIEGYRPYWSTYVTAL